MRNSTYDVLARGGSMAASGCGAATAEAEQGLFTSGSREADQRAANEWPKRSNLAGSGEGSGERWAKGRGLKPTGDVRHHDQ